MTKEQIFKQALKILALLKVDKQHQEVIWPKANKRTLSFLHREKLIQRSYTFQYDYYEVTQAGLDFLERNT